MDYAIPVGLGEMVVFERYQPCCVYGTKANAKLQHSHLSSAVYVVQLPVLNICTRALPKHYRYPGVHPVYGFLHSHGH